MRELTAVLLAVLLVSGGMLSGQAALRNWIDARSAAAAGASMGPFVTAARDYLEANYETVATAVPNSGDVTFVTPATLKTSGLLSPAWQDSAWGGQRHALAVRRQSGDSLLALAFTYGGRALEEDALILAARAAPVGTGYLSSEFSGKAVSAAGDWEVARSDFAGSSTDPALADGHLATVLFAHRGRVLGPWLCRSEVPGRPECNEMTAALRIALPSGSSLQGSDQGALEVVHGTAGENALDVTGASAFDGTVGITQATGTALSVAGAASIAAASGTALTVSGDTSLGGAASIGNGLTVGSSATVAGTVFARNFRVQSDPRAKRALEPLSCTPELRRRLAGIGLHHWRWRSGGGRGFGYDARDVAARFPDLVARDPGGTLHVDYTALGALQHACAGPAPADRTPESRTTAEAARACPAGRYRLERWWPAAVTAPSGQSGKTVYVGGPDGLASCRLIRAHCADPRPGHHGWKIACAPGPGFAFWPEPVSVSPEPSPREERS